MLPWGHLAVGYVVYSLAVRAWFRCPPTGAPTVALALGTQLPDLIDKPLTWWFNVFDGRAFGHSVLAMLPVCLGVYLLARQRGLGRAGGAFGVGVATHLVSDAWRALVTGTVREGAPYLLWPVLPAPIYPKGSLAAHAAVLRLRLQLLPWHSPVELLTGWLGKQLLVFGLLVGLWVVDGRPGLEFGKRVYPGE